MTAEILIYRLDRKDTLKSLDPIPYKIEHWKPGLFSGFRMKRFPFKYNLFWFFHFLGIFSNSKYAAISIRNGQDIVAALLIVPTFYKWQFMKKHDVQLTYVVTHKEYRGKGMGKYLLSYANEMLRKAPKGDVWYVTDSSNIASQRLAASSGFILEGIGIKKRYLSGLVKRLFLSKKTEQIINSTN